MVENAEIIHATCVSIGERGILIRGPSGAGKSDLALRLLCRPLPPRFGGVQLVSDDQVHLTPHTHQLIATTPPNLENKLEVRGIGIVPIETRPSVPVHLVVDGTVPAEVTRMPEREERITTLCGLTIPRLAVSLLEPSCPAKVLIALDLAQTTQTGFSTA